MQNLKNRLLAGIKLLAHTVLAAGACANAYAAWECWSEERFLASLMIFMASTYIAVLIILHLEQRHNHGANVQS